jgi:hypothetical protein
MTSNKQEETGTMKQFLTCILFAGAALVLLPATGLAAVDCANLATSAGAVPPDLAAACGGQSPVERPILAPTDMATSPDALLATCSSMTLNNPAAPFDFGFIDFRPACDFADGDFSQLYCYDFNIPATLYSVDTTSCVETFIGFANNGGLQSMSGMAWDFTTGTMYASTTDITTSELHTVNLGTGATTFVGGMGAASPGNIAIAAMGGQMYGFDIVNDSLQSIDKFTGVATTIGPLGFDGNFAQGMDFDESDGTCYLFAFNNGLFNAELRTCDVTTGASVPVGIIGNGIDLREWTGAGVMTVPPTGGCANPLYCFAFDNFADGIEICQVLGDKTVVGFWKNWDAAGSTAPMLGGYSGKNVSPRLSWLAADPLGTFSAVSFNLNVDNKTFDLFEHDIFGNLFQFQDNEPYSVSVGACPFSPAKAGLPSAMDR